MNLGRELVACALRERTMKPFLEAGINHEYLIDEQDPSRSGIFPSEDFAAWSTLLGHWDKHAKVPSVDMFRKSYPASSYELPESDHTPDELVEEFRKDRRRLIARVAVSDMSDRVAEENIEAAAELMERAAKMMRDGHASRSTVVGWDSPDYDVEARISREIIRGAMTGIDGFDSQEGFLGFQPGSLICYLGRAKAGKTSFALLSALRAWEDGKRVLFLSFEIAAGRTPDEPGIVDRMDSFGAKIDMLRYMQGRLSRDDADQLRAFRKTCTDDVFKVVQPNGRYTVTDLEADIERFEPDIVYVDGFYFMTDTATGKPGSHWEGHDNLANDIKAIAMNHMVPIVITHQVREKQLTGKRGAGIDDGAMMGGTAIIMFADLVIGVDADDEENRTLSCTRSRLMYLESVHGTWNWSDCTFSEKDNPFDQEVFGYERGGHDD